MNVLIITQIYAPEMGAPTVRLSSLAQGLLRGGHKVFVATGMPNYPAGKVFPEYQSKWWQREVIDGVEVFRTAYFTTPRNQSRWKQLFSYMTFLPACFLSALRAGPVDCIVVSSPPIFPVIVARILSVLRRAKLVYDVRDLWPDEIVACGGAREGSLPIRVISVLERMIYRRADRILCTTKSFMRIIESRGVSPERLRLIPNGADTTRFKPLESAGDFRQRWNLENRFIVLYSGVLGLKHGLEMLVKAAERLKDLQSIAFVMVGDGASRPRLEKMVDERQLKNVYFVGEHPSDQIPQIINSVDLCVTTLQASPYLQNILAVKIFEYLACGKAVVAAVNGESRRVLEESGGGIAVAPDDDAAFAEAIRAIYNEPDRRRNMEQCGPQFVRENYCRVSIADRFCTEIEAVRADGDVR